MTRANLLIIDCITIPVCFTAAEQPTRRATWCSVLGAPARTPKSNAEHSQARVSETFTFCCLISPQAYNKMSDAIRSFVSLIVDANQHTTKCNERPFFSPTPLLLLLDVALCSALDWLPRRATWRRLHCLDGAARRGSPRRSHNSNEADAPDHSSSSSRRTRHLQCGAKWWRRCCSSARPKATRQIVHKSRSCKCQREYSTRMQAWA
jgi:hypothetical protein